MQINLTCKSNPVCWMVASVVNGIGYSALTPSKGGEPCNWSWGTLLVFLLEVLPEVVQSQSGIAPAIRPPIAPPTYIPKGPAKAPTTPPAKGADSCS